MKEWSLMKTRAESARIALEKAVREHPGDPRFHASLGLAYAYLGRKTEAIQEGNHAVKLHPVSKDATFGPRYFLNLTRIYAVIGEHEKAIDQLLVMIKDTSWNTRRQLFEYFKKMKIRDPRLIQPLLVVLRDAVRFYEKPYRDRDYYSRGDVCDASATAAGLLADIGDKDTALALKKMSENADKLGLLGRSIKSAAERLEHLLK